MGSINELVWMGVWCVEIELRRMTMNDIGNFYANDFDSNVQNGEELFLFGKKIKLQITNTKKKKNKKHTW